MRAWGVGWTAAATLLITAVVATAMVHAGCTSVYDDLYKPLAGTGGGAGNDTGGSGMGGSGTSGGGLAGAGTGGVATGGAGTGGVATGGGTGGCEPIDDGQDCTVDLCENGTPTTMPAREGMACDDDGGAVCNGSGICVACNTNADCLVGAAPICDANQCVDMACANGVKDGTETDVDCGGSCAAKCALGEACAGSDASCEPNAYCAGDLCAAKVSNGAACAADDQCLGGICESSDGVCCDAQCAGTCKSCKLPGQEGQCLDVPALQDTDEECAGTDVCDGSGACKKGLGDTCLLPGSCASGFCSDGLCCDTECDQSCMACVSETTGAPSGTCANVTMSTDPDDDCPGVTTCDGAGACTKLAGGSLCDTALECASGFCADGVCCDGACAGACAACTQAKKGSGADGLCGFVAPGSDPDAECLGADVCDGTGLCKKPNGAGCGSGGLCASGNCVDGVCCDMACSGACRSCNAPGAVGTCTNHPAGSDPENGCNGGNPNCNGQGTCGLGLQGAPCASGAGCSNGQCVDGFCCNGSCAGACQACAMALTGQASGACSPISNGTDPDNNCSGITPNCDGAGACGLGSAGVSCTTGAQCQSGSCAAGFCAP